MADITMCKGKNCPIRDNCYRFTAKKDTIGQSYFVKEPIENGVCDMYWGKQNSYIVSQLQDIVNGKKKK